MNNVHTCKPLFCLLEFQGLFHIILHFIALFEDGAEKAKSQDVPLLLILSEKPQAINTVSAYFLYHDRRSKRHILFLLSLGWAGWHAAFCDIHPISLLLGTLYSCSHSANSKREKTCFDGSENVSAQVGHNLVRLSLVPCCFHLREQSQCFRMMVRGVVALI